VDAEWITSPTARRILIHWAGRHPAWLWSQDGATLLWHNPAARYFNGRIKKSGLKLSSEAVPIKGQVSRLIRLGHVGQSSLSRVQLLAGDKPLSETCTCTPLAMPDGSTALLLVGSAKIDKTVIEAAGGLSPDATSEALFPAGTDYLLVRDGHILGGSAGAVAAGIPGDGATSIEAGNKGEALLLFATPATQSRIADIRDEEGVSSDEEPHQRDLADMPEPMLPLGLEALPEAISPSLPRASDDWVEPIPEGPNERALSSLFDRLADDAELYTTLTAADEVFEGPAAPEPAPPQPDLIAAVIEYADDPEPAPTPAGELPPLPADEPKSHWMITGRGFRALQPEPPAPEPEPPVREPEPPLAEPAALTEVATSDPVADAETAERVSRYNFEELGRILTDRVSGEPARVEPEPAIAPRPPSPDGVINLNAETLVLNRLPLAILVFRDQQVLFANRALTDMLGHESIQSLRAAGMASIFPALEETNAGPVNRLMRRDGTPLPVAARLQSVSWQGRAALMLSASPAEPVRGHEGAVRAFAEISAEAREEGFVISDRAGIITQLSGHGGVLLGRPANEVIGKPLAVLVGKADMEPLRTFLEKPARFAETSRPSFAATSEDGETDIVLFAEGQAGIVSGYFGFMRRRHRPVQPSVPGDDIEPSILGRLSRGIRQPLNTIIGFADLIRSAAFGSLDNDRYVEYARDIRTAGLDIAVLVDELDDFTRLREGRYAARPTDVELGALLESCIARVRNQAGQARVLVRSAISEQLPRIHADRASLGQALLNLLASAIDQTPVGGSVILSAQHDEDGTVAIHIRDGAETSTELGERFVVFRDGVDKDGEPLGPVRSSVGLALTRSLLAVNACSLSVDPTAGVGTLFSLIVPGGLIVKEAKP
jgi:PAS domain-containing protein